jgi:hypothetical protein
METSTRPRVVVITKTPAPAAAPSKVSTGLAGGLGAGAAVIVLLISGIVFWLWRRKRKARKAETKVTPYTPIAGEQTPVTNDSPVTPFTPMAYHNVAPSEIEARKVRHEMSQDSMKAAELPTSSKGIRIEGMDRVNEIQEMPAADVMARDAGGKR